MSEQDQDTEILNLKKQIEFILGAAKTGLDIIDANLNIRYIDPEWQKVYGDYKGKKCFEYFMGRAQVCPDCGVLKALNTKKPVVSEEVLAKENNRPIQVTTIPFQNEKGEWLVAEVNVDISERKYGETELLKQKQLLSEILSVIPEFIFWKNRNFHYAGCNENFAKVAGVESPQRIIGKTDYDLAWTKEQADFFRRVDQEVMEKAEPILNIEETQRQADGREAILLTHRVPLKDNDGAVVGILGIYSDITAFRKAEQELKQKVRDLERFHKVAVDRELKMIELKKRIKDLESKIG